MEAASRRAERESQRRYRQLQRDEKQQAKMEARQQAAHEVEVFENQIDRLLSVHKESPEAWDWNGIYNSLPPTAPERGNVREARAATALNAFVPGFLDKLLGRVENKREALTQALEAAKAQDEQEYQQVYQDYYQRYTDWDERRQLAWRILQGDTQAYVDALVDFNPFADISELGASLDFKPHDAQLVELRLTANGERLIPNQIKSLASTGKLSAKAMPKAQYYEIYRDFVCGVALRAGRELFAFLPVQTILVNIQANLLNTRTGHQGLETILSVVMPRTLFAQLNFNRLDPSDAMENFPHRMSFKKPTGFEAVEPLSGEQPCQNKQTTLYYREGTSDKVYQVSLEQQGGGFVVNFAFGRRGFPLKTGSKTTTSISHDEAEALYDGVIGEKTAKGYTEDPSGIPCQDAEKAAGTRTASREADESGLPRLMTDWPEQDGCHYIPAGAVASLLGIEQEAKLTVGVCRQITNAIEDCGYCVEPDTRFGGGSYDRDQVLGIFKSAEGESVAPSPAYHGAANLLKLSVLVAAADGAVDPHELKVFRQVIESQLHFSQTELKRLAVLERLLTGDTASGLKTLAKVAKAVPADKRLLVGQVLVKVAAVDHVITKSEYRALERVFKAFELPPQTLSELMLEVCPAPEEATIQEGERGSPGEAIPGQAAQCQPQGFSLDMSKVYAITNETREVVGILSVVMEDEQDGAPPSATSVAPGRAAVSMTTELPGTEGTSSLTRFSGLDPAFHPVLERLLAKESWPRRDFHALAGEFHLMPLSIHDVINEWADESLGNFLLDGEDPILVRRELILKETN